VSEAMNTMDRTPVVELREIKKSFGAVQALCGVDLALGQNEVLGLVGENAAGKSTLMKVLSGAYIPDSGGIYLDGQRVHLSGPEEARRLGIEMVYQDFALANNLDVASNVFLGREIVRLDLGLLRIMNKARMEDEARRLMDRLKIDISSVKLRVENLSGGQRQAVAIARGLLLDAPVLIMDEPTNAMDNSTEEQFKNRLASVLDGRTLLLVTHRASLLSLVTRVIVMDGGRVVADGPRDQVLEALRGGRLAGRAS